MVPGVGAFAAVMEGLPRRRAATQVVDRRLAGGRPVLGICVGMQVMFERGEEHGVEAEGLGEWPGVVDRLEADVVPHMGWSPVDAPAGSVLFDGHRGRALLLRALLRRAHVPAAGTDAARFTPPLVTWSEHGGRFVAAVENGPLSATPVPPGEVR